MRRTAPQTAKPRYSSQPRRSATAPFRHTAGSRSHTSPTGGTAMPPKTPPPVHPHLTPMQTLAQVALTQAQRPRSEPVSTVQLSLNARGDTQITVDVDDPDPAEAAR